MPLLSSTPSTRRVPAAGGRWREARVIRGVGAKERAMGYAYGQDHLYSNMGSKERAAYGSQKNYAAAMENKAEQRAQEQMKDEARRNAQQGYADGAGLSSDPAPAAQDSGEPAPQRTSAPAINHAETILGRARRRGLTASLTQSGQPTHDGEPPLMRYPR